MFSRLTASLLLGFGLCALAACPGSLESPERFLGGLGGGAACPDIEGSLFPARCGTAGCHNPTDQAGNLDLTSPDVASRLVGVPGTDDCNNALLVDDSDIEGSLMVTKLDSSPSCGLAMPLVGAPLTDAEIACVVTYLEGIAGNGGPTSTTGGGMGGAGGGAGAASGGMGGSGGQ